MKLGPLGCPWVGSEGGEVEPVPFSLPLSDASQRETEQGDTGTVVLWFLK